MMTIDIPTPGLAAPCRTCGHYMPDLWWHPTPCGHVRWEGPRHVKPALERDDRGVVTCSDYSPTEAAEPTPIAEGAIG